MRIAQYRFVFLFCFLLVIYLLAPLSISFPLRIALNLTFTFTLLSAIYSACREKSHVVVGLSLAIPLTILNWANEELMSPDIGMIIMIGLGVFFIYISYTIFRYILAERTVTVNTIFASLSVYFMIGLIFAFAYGIIEALQPGSFQLATQMGERAPLGGPGTGAFSTFFYYSFVTMTTLGYGDITPITPFAGSVSTLEAIIGQIYLVVLVARLVALQVKSRGDT